MDLVELERLVEMVQNADIRELTLRQGSARVTIRKRASSGSQALALIPAGERSESGNEYVVETQTGLEFDAEDGAPIDPLERITAPLVGIFHHVKPVVGLNARVSEGQVVGMIEAMKLDNDVTAPCDGVITDVLIEDSLPVEYGQALFVLRPESQEG